METLAEVERASWLRESARVRARIGRDGRARKRALWPPEVRDKIKGVFTSYRSLNGLRALGLKTDQIRIDIRSRRDYGFFVLGAGMLGRGRTLSEATAELINMLALEKSPAMPRTAIGIDEDDGRREKANAR